MLMCNFLIKTFSIYTHYYSCKCIRPEYAPMVAPDLCNHNHTSQPPGATICHETWEKRRKANKIATLVRIYYVQEMA